MKRILVTGANGFVGQVLCRELSNYFSQILGLVRNSVPARSGPRKLNKPISGEFATF